VSLASSTIDAAGLLSASDGADFTGLTSKSTGTAAVTGLGDVASDSDALPPRLNKPRNTPVLLQTSTLTVSQRETYHQLVKSSKLIQVSIPQALRGAMLNASTPPPYSCYITRNVPAQQGDKAYMQSHSRMPNFDHFPPVNYKLIKIFTLTLWAPYTWTYILVPNMVKASLASEATANIYFCDFFLDTSTQQELV